MGILNDICKAHGITLKCIHGGATGAGCAIARGDEKYIVVDGDAPLWEQRFTAAHEIAHHLFGHLRAGGAAGTLSAEMEANTFAAVITAVLLLQEQQTMHQPPKPTPPSTL